ncbi:putative phage terminase small subunit [Agrobacterium rubi TR3 = NBRC 13261]|uniref:Putative phage terminase small subunit n=1 Tax=Agrobacterium rubi TR3 = NBRC 13261 TaxID=1368415 RepID=A0A081CWU3_9HYPH|nr:phage terminase small subunit P27 family [Agrobacterium rubi]MBP1878106.1 P27 family predicted phage terminase small subunit [Agrobacterium rubi]GAK71139.1 putative phage terminase small subunit [Agrobacterium rubi TR3 = NBRC 13261]
MRGLKPSVIVPGSSTVLTVPKPPAYLSRDAKAEWKRVAHILTHERKILTEADLAALENYVIAVATMREAHRELQTSGLIVNGKRNPVSTILKDSQMLSLRAASELGLTPAARSRAAIMQVSSDDDDDNPLAVV